MLIFCDTKYKLDIYQDLQNVVKHNYNAITQHCSVLHLCCSYFRQVDIFNRV